MKTELNIYTGLSDSAAAAVQPINVPTMMTLITVCFFLQVNPKSIFIAVIFMLCPGR